MELTAGNLSRPRGPGRGQQICEESPVTGLSQNFPPDLRAPASKSLRLGWDFHTSAIFSDLPMPPTYIHAAQKIPMQTLRSILGGLGPPWWVSTVLLGCSDSSFRQSIVFWSGVAVLDPKFAQDSESGLRSRQSPAGKDENCTQSPAS